jgi:AraC-like DNA-binding protein
MTEGQRRVVAPRPNRDMIIIPRAISDLSAFPGIASTGVSLGSVLFIPANTCNRIGFGNGHSAIVLSVCPSLRQQVHLRLNQIQGMAPATAVMVQGQRQIGAILTMIRRVAAEATPQPHEELHLLVELLLWSLARAAITAPKPPTTRQPRLSRKDIERIDRFIDDNLEAGLRLQQLAELVGMSRYHFLRCFKRATGLSPLQYVLIRRVDRAQVLLAQGHESIAEIAYATGFSSQSHLNTMFKRHFGATPGAYRRRAVAGHDADHERGEQCVAPLPAG